MEASFSLALLLTCSLALLSCHGIHVSPRSIETIRQLICPFPLLLSLLILPVAESIALE